MTIIRDAQLNLQLTHILRRQGIKGQSSRPEMIAITEELLKEVKEHKLLDPVFSYHLYPILEIMDDRISLKNGVIINGKLFVSLLSKSREFGAIVCTIGPGLEKKAAEHLKEGHALRGLLLDGIGNAAIDTLTAKACKYLREVALSQGFQASSPLSPGMPDFPISEQKMLLKLASADQIGIQLTSTGIMVPSKSTSAVIGIGADMPTWTPAEVCSQCNLHKTCPYRIAVKAKT